jgi:hypothetical protein
MILGRYMVNSVTCIEELVVSISNEDNIIQDLSLEDWVSVFIWNNRIC